MGGVPVRAAAKPAARAMTMQMVTPGSTTASRWAGGARRASRGRGVGTARPYLSTNARSIT